MTKRVSSVAVAKPPIIEAAIRCMISEPVPAPIMIGRRPAKIVATVMTLGLRRSSAPSKTTSSISARTSGLGASREAHAAVPGEVQIEQRDDGGLDGDARERDEADEHGDREVEAEIPDQPHPAGERYGQWGEDDRHLGHPFEGEEDHQRDDQERRRRDDPEAFVNALVMFVPARPGERVARRQRHPLGDDAARVRDTPPEIALGDVDGDEARAPGVLRADHARAVDDRDRGDGAERTLL